MKTPVGTASSGVQLVVDTAGLRRLLASGALAEAWGDGGVLFQVPAQGPLAMVQAIFDGARPVAMHANLRVREGARGGASKKRSVHLPAACAAVEAIGSGLGWHGALSADVIVTAEGPLLIDINPRLVEPGNAWASGTDLVGALLEVALGSSSSSLLDPRTPS